MTHVADPPPMGGITPVQNIRVLFVNTGPETQCAAQDLTLQSRMYTGE